MEVKVAVTTLEYNKAQQVFEDAARMGLACIALAEEEIALAEGIARLNAQHAIVGVARYTGRLYQALPRGAVVARFGVGHDGIDKAVATANGILCTNTPGALDDSVTEHAMALLLAAARRIPSLARATSEGLWKPVMGCELRGKTLAVIGCGPIGRRVAQMATFGLGMRVLGCETQTVDQADMKTRFGFDRVVPGIAEAVRDADFVSLHLPSTPTTKHLVNATLLAGMPRRAWLINTARGAIVDEAALYDALAGGRLAGAALDVFENEPYAPVNPARDLRTLANVIMTPHVSSSTPEACERMAQRALHNITLAQRGEYQSMNLLNPDVLPTMRTT